MKYIHIDQPGPNSKLIFKEGPTPTCSPTQLLVKVKATAINRADLMQRQGIYPPPPGESDIPGLELSGDVIAIGSKVTQFKVGDKVYALVGSGAYADHCLVEEKLAHVIPDNWDYQTAAALPEALATVFSTIFNIGKLTEKQTLLVHGAGSGIASLAIQMAKIIGANVITTAGDNKKLEKARPLGADQLINYKEQDFAEIIEDNSVDLILDFIGGDYFNKHLLLLKPQGKLIQIATLKGHKVECNLATIMRKRLQINGFVLRAQSLVEKAILWEAAHKQWGPFIINKRLQPIVDSIYPFSQLDQAHEHMKSGKNFGKIVIEM